MSYQILIPQDIAKEGKELLLQKGCSIKMGTGITEEDLIRDVADCDAILLRTAVVSRAVLEAGRKLKIVARHGAGYNNVDMEAADRLGIWVTNTPDATTNSVAEFTMGAVLSAAKRTHLLSRKLKENDFYAKNTCKGMDLEGKTLAIIGFGRIGQAVAKKAYYGFSMKVIAYTPHVRKELVPDYVTMVSWEEAFSQADFISLHMPLKKDNRECIGEAEFNRMKNTAFLINCARGEVVNEKALIDALVQEKIAGAFIDVFQQEPPAADNPLLFMENVIATPHMASNTEECMRRMAVQAASQIILVLSGEQPDWPVNCPGSTKK